MNLVLLRRYYNVINEKYIKLCQKKEEYGLDLYESGLYSAYREIFLLLKECM